MDEPTSAILGVRVHTALSMGDEGFLGFTVDYIYVQLRMYL